VGTEAAVVDDAGNIEETDETDDAAAEPAAAEEPVAAAAEPAKRIPGADFEPGPTSPFNADGSLRWSQREADIRHDEVKENEQKAADRKRREDSW